MSPKASQAKKVFLEALEKHTPDQWPRFLEEACEGDPALRAHVEALLKAHGESNPMLDGTGVVPAVSLPAITERPGTVIGPYKLLEQIGEGGMGLVFMARQREPVKRNVA